MLKILIAFFLGLFSIFSWYYPKVVLVFFPLIGFALAVFGINESKNFSRTVLGSLAMLTCVVGIVIGLLVYYNK